MWQVADSAGRKGVGSVEEANTSAAKKGASTHVEQPTQRTDTPTTGEMQGTDQKSKTATTDPIPVSELPGSSCGGPSDNTDLELLRYSLCPMHAVGDSLPLRSTHLSHFLFTLRASKFPADIRCVLLDLLHHRFLFDVFISISFQSSSNSLVLSTFLSVLPLAYLHHLDFFISGISAPSGILQQVFQDVQQSCLLQ